MKGIMKSQSPMLSGTVSKKGLRNGTYTAVKTIKKELPFARASTYLRRARPKTGYSVRNVP